MLLAFYHDVLFMLSILVAVLFIIFGQLSSRPYERGMSERSEDILKSPTLLVSNGALLHLNRRFL
ncbi:hypothetical protein Mjas_02260 [Methanothermococcus sp. Ax23]|uniref:hypothetical protein n=1 Tax=Methanothermococcus sp. Ax23 TaxID=3156486 RepID=UPI003BA16731